MDIEPHANALAVLPFSSPRSPHRAGVVSLENDRTIRITVSPALHDELNQFARQVDVSALKWGASLVYVWAAVGTACWVKGWKPLAWAAFGLSAATGVLGGSARKYVQNWTDLLLAPHPLDKISVVEDDGGLRFDLILGNGPLLKGAFRLVPGEFDKADASRFLAALSAAKGEFRR